ncbi:MAG: hypothetical protein HFG82_09635 [Dorea sp.]|nr:hypothetical protein [Dorea sp.]
MKMRLDTKKIYLAMAGKGLTATEIAKQGGVSQQAVSNALNGNRIGMEGVFYGRKEKG